MVVQKKRILRRQKKRDILLKLQAVLESTSIGLIVSYMLYILKNSIQIKKYMRQKNVPFDVVLSHTVIDTVSLFFLKRKFPNLKIITVYHGQGPLFFELEGYGAIKYFKVFNFLLRAFTQNLEFLCFRISDYLGFPSRGAKRELLRLAPYLRENLERKKTFILYNTLKITLSGTNEEIIDDEKRSKLAFITVANLNYMKGVDRVPEVLDFIAKSIGYPFEWILIGRGNEDIKSLILREIEVNGLKDRTKLVEEYIDDKTLATLLKSSKFYIMLHRVSIFDLVTLEAMFYGAIPILSNTGGNKDIIFNYKNGVLINYQNSSATNLPEVALWIKKLYDNPKDIRKIRILNRKKIKEKFSPEQFKLRYQRMIMEVAQR